MWKKTRWKIDFPVLLSFRSGEGENEDSEFLLCCLVEWEPLSSGLSGEKRPSERGEDEGDNGEEGEDEDERVLRVEEKQKLSSSSFHERR